MGFKIAADFFSPLLIYILDPSVQVFGRFLVLTKNRHQKHFPELIYLKFCTVIPYRSLTKCMFSSPLNLSQLFAIADLFVM